MPLKIYRTKRNFKKTPEPYGKVSKQKNNLYLIQKHAASHLHYDLRLELDGVLKSWAVPKGPSLDPSVKRLAVHVEDHPLSYGSFEGIIPEGEYGGGTVMLWDTGKWFSLDENPKKSYLSGNMKFILKGKKLKGGWKLIQLKNDPKNWLLIKIDDEYARPESEFNITEAKPLSVASRKTMDKIAQTAKKTWSSNKKVSTVKKKVKKFSKVFSRTKKDKMPSSIFPELATLTAKPPPGKEWLHEIKLDGYRMITFISEGKVKLITRGKQDWTAKFPNLISSIKKLNIKNAILDGEIVALDEAQQSDFQLLQNLIHSGDDKTLVYYLFDMLYYYDSNLTKTALIDRKEMLRKIVSKSHSSTIRYSDHIIGDGTEVFKSTCKLGLEGIISKRLESPYLQMRTRDWLKIKCIERQEFVIAGFTKPSGSRSYFGSLLIGYYAKNNELQYAGHVGTGFTEESLKNLYKLLLKYKTEHRPFAKIPAEAKRAIWVKPMLVAEVEFTEWTKEGVLRHPSFKGLRTDKTPQEVKMETPSKLKVVESKKSKSTKALPITNPERILYPEQGITKLELAQYYESIQDWILPYITKRPLTLVRCPTGNHKKCFYQKHLDKNVEGPLFTLPIKEKTTTDQYIYIKNTSGLIALVQLGVLEIHPWPALIADVERPDYMVFDLDPALDVDWKKVVDAAFFVKEQLELLNLTSFVKTTGGKGLHIVVPFKRNYTWDEVKLFARSFAYFMVQQRPKDFIATMTKAKRGGKIFIDFFRNQRGATSIAPYSTRVKPNAPVSTPLAWSELTSRIKSDSFTIKNLPDRLSKLKKDPWEDFFKIKQGLRLKK